MTKFLSRNLSLYLFSAVIFSISVFVPNYISAESGPKGQGTTRSCEVRQEGVKSRMSHLVQLATNMEVVFGKHLTRIENYYNTNLVPAGKKVNNYDSLLSDIQTKKTATQQALAKTNNDVSNFSCTGNKAKTLMTQFREDMQVVKKDLKEYRTAVKNLVVAVHASGVEGKMEKSK